MFFVFISDSQTPVPIWLLSGPGTQDAPRPSLWAVRGLPSVPSAPVGAKRMSTGHPAPLRALSAREI